MSVPTSCFTCYCCRAARNMLSKFTRPTTRVCADEPADPADASCLPLASSSLPLWPIGVTIDGGELTCWRCITRGAYLLEMHCPCWHCSKLKAVLVQLSGCLLCGRNRTGAKKNTNLLKDETIERRDDCRETRVIVAHICKIRVTTR